MLWLFTYLLSDAKSLKWAYRELQKVKMSQALKWKKKAHSSFILILANSWIHLAAGSQFVVMIIHSSPALLISQCFKFNHESLVTPWLLVSFQRSAGVLVKLSLVRKNTCKLLRQRGAIFQYSAKILLIHWPYDKIVFI